MGASNSYTQHVQAGGIIINVDNPYYKPGDAVKGNVYISMAQSYSTASLNLNLKVEQYTKFRQDDNANAKKDVEGYKLLFSSSVTLVKFTQNLIAPGQYQYPFTFSLPKNLPGSFEYYDEYNTAYTTYILDAMLPAVHSKNVKNIIKNSVLLIVNQPLQSLGIMSKKENSANLNAWCCIPKGSSSLKVMIPKENFYTNDKITANCELDNRMTKLDGSNIRISLIQSIVLRDNFGRTKQILKNISKLNYRNLYRKGEISRFTLEIPLIDYFNPTAKYLDKCDHLNLLKNGNLVSHFQASISSDLINCSYLLKVNAFYDSHFMTSRTPELDLSLAIYIPDIRIDINQYIPSNWNPDVMDNINVDFPLPTAEDLGVEMQKEVVIQ